MTTIANRKSESASHWYDTLGNPCYEVPYADPKKGMRPTTLADAKKRNLLPSVTTVLRTLHRQALVDWLCEQTALACVTTPRLPDEADDAFVYRVLHTERQQDQEAQAARDRGTEIHAGLESMFKGELVSLEMEQWCKPVYLALAKRGEVKAVEQVVVGQGYAGKVDLQLTQPDGLWIYDYKTSRKIPKEPYPEARLQLAAYREAIDHPAKRCANVYISTVTPGDFVILEHEDEQTTFEQGFMPLLRHWQWATGYKPLQS